jgi:hypothetical protein
MSIDLIEKMDKDIQYSMYHHKDIHSMILIQVFESKSFAIHRLWIPLASDNEDVEVTS